MNAAVDIDSARFHRDGFLIIPGMADARLCDQMIRVSTAHLEQQMAPIEYEVDVKYPGAPVDPDGEGGRTSRRLLQAFSRHEVFRDWAVNDDIKQVLKGLLHSERVMVSQCHHNCMMTKQPGYSSVTLWHQDNRYWSFDVENLVSVWLALGDETKDNGCLRVIPGSHKLDLPPGRFDAAKFLRPELAENKQLLSAAQAVSLRKGDVLFFHSRLFHAAGRNLTEQTKFSLVFTYHEAANRPIAGTRSDRFPSIEL